jgi:hypothetical protein
MATDNNSGNRASGEVSWSNTKLFDGSKPEKKDEWLRLATGSNIVRIVTNPFQYYQHQLVIPGDTKPYGRRIPCSRTKDTGCPICEKGGDENKAKRRWLLGVIDRKTNMFKILDVGYGVFKGIQVLANDADWGNPQEFNCDILNSGQGAQRYAVIGKPKTPLSASDLALIEEHGTESLVFRTTPPSYERVQEIIQKIQDSISNQNGGGATGQQLTSALTTESGSDNDQEEEDTFFKEYTKKAK